MSTFSPPRSFTGDTLTIRTYEPSDAHALCDATNQSYEHLKRFMPWATRTQTVAETAALITTFEANYTACSDFVLGIWRNHDHAFLGGSGFHLREGPLEGKCAEIGMWIAAEHAGQGVGREALKTILQWGFTQWPWLRLAWRCNVENVASVRCAEHNGMSHEGTLRGQYNPIDQGRRNTVCYGVLRDEWHAQRAVIVS